jgi:hypothetical protein
MIDPGQLSSGMSATMSARMTETARADVAIVDGPIQMRRRKLMMPPAPSINHPSG